jgi:predicted secreted protein
MKKEKQKVILTLFFIHFIFALLNFFVSDVQSYDKKVIEENNNEQKIKEKVVGYLESSTLDNNFGGKAFADYYRFDKQGNKLYIWAYVVEYYIKNDNLEMGAGRSGPMVITFSNDGAIKYHWEPRLGKKYAHSIKDLFPEKYHEDVLNFQTKHEDILHGLKKNVRERARQASRTGSLKVDFILKPGDVKHIKLKANRTTGFKWFYTIDNKQIVEVVSDKYRQYEHKEKVLGTGGERVLSIKGISSGTARIRLKYQREWNPEEVAKTKVFEVKVKNRSQVSFDIPNDLDAEYIYVMNCKVDIFYSHVNFPSRFRVADGQVQCKKSTKDNELPIKILKKEIDNRKYCIKVTSEGASGSVYKSYTYATVKSYNLIVFNLTARFSACGNFNEPKRSQCKRERKEFDLDSVVDRVVQSINFN